MTTPTPRCEMTREGWGPHPGCREFMLAPEVLVCGDEAVFRVSYAELEECFIPEMGINCVLVNVHHVFLCLDDTKNMVDKLAKDDEHVICVRVAKVTSPIDIQERPGTYAYTPDHVARLRLTAAATGTAEYYLAGHHTGD